MAMPLARFGKLDAASHWRTVEFISDVHLQPEDASTFMAWAGYLKKTRADALFILGDLFEAWVGDDALTADDGLSRFETDCASRLHETSQRCQIFFMHGNRDFLIGQAFADRSGVTLLEDPTILTFNAQRWLLSHGDALCLSDTDYLKFRAQVRQTDWQRNFLRQPLPQRRELAQQLRRQSQAHQHERIRLQQGHIEVDDDAAAEWLAASGASELIHGHTHRPGEHALADGRHRRVLSDWDARSSPPRLEVLRLTHDPDKTGIQRITLAG